MGSTPSGIVETAPLHGVELTGRDPKLPHATSAALRASAGESPGAQRALATGGEGAKSVAAWRDTAKYTLPPLLDPRRTELQGERDRLARESVEIMNALQEAAARGGPRDRGFQRTTLYATTTALFRVPGDLPPELEAGPFRAGASYRAIVRFSSAASVAQADTVPDQRAAGVRITDDAGRVQDLTFTSGAAGNHARGARQFNSSMKAALHLARGRRLRAMAGLLVREGPREMMRLARARRESLDSEVSLAALRYYSRSPIEMGSKLVHLALVPPDGTDGTLAHEAQGARTGLGRDLSLRRADGDVVFRVVAAEAPGLDDTSVAPAGPWITVGELLLPRQDVSEAQMLAAAARVHGELAMHPFNVWRSGELTARGELNEILRGPVYRASAANSGRKDHPPRTPQYEA